MKQTSIVSIATLITLLVASCSSTGTDGGGTTQPGDTDVSAVESTASTAATNAAAAISDSTYSSLASRMGSTFSSLAGYFDDWDTSTSGWEQSGNVWTYEAVVNNQVLARWEVTDTGSGWSYELYFDMDDDSVLEKWFSGTVSYDGDDGSYSYYDASGTVVAEATWTVAGDQVTYTYEVGSYTITMVTATDGSSGTITFNDGSTTQSYTW